MSPYIPPPSPNSMLQRVKPRCVFPSPFSAATDQLTRHRLFPAEKSSVEERRVCPFDADAAICDTGAYAAWPVALMITWLISAPCLVASRPRSHLMVMS